MNCVIFVADLVLPSSFDINQPAVDRSFILTRCTECAMMMNSPCTTVLHHSRGENNNKTSKNLVSTDTSFQEPKSRFQNLSSAVLVVGVKSPSVEWMLTISWSFPHPAQASMIVVIAVGWSEGGKLKASHGRFAQAKLTVSSRDSTTSIKLLKQPARGLSFVHFLPVVARKIPPIKLEFNVFRDQCWGVCAGHKYFYISIQAPYHIII